VARASNPVNDVCGPSKIFQGRKLYKKSEFARRAHQPHCRILLTPRPQRLAACWSLKAWTACILLMGHELSAGRLAMYTLLISTLPRDAETQQRRAMAYGNYG